GAASAGRCNLASGSPGSCARSSDPTIPRLGRADERSRRPSTCVDYLAVNPASTGSATPVTYRASSETSQAMALLTSTASLSWTSRRLPRSPPLDAGASANSLATASLITIGVFAPAGCTELTRMLCGASQCAQVRPRPTMACLLAQ